jgi:hypothetical protein
MQSIAFSPAIQEAVTEAQAELARRRLKHFCLRMSPKLRLDKPFHDLVFSEIEALERGDMLDEDGEPMLGLIVALPVRHGKSEIISKHLPAWLLGRDPSRQIMLASNSASLSTRNSRFARNLFKDPLWPFAAKVAEDSSAADDWAIEGDDGTMRAVGMTSVIVGRGADFLIVDDPFAGIEDAMSPSQREKIWQWFLEDAFPRLQPNAKILICATRWNEDDLTGRLLRSEFFKRKFKYLRLPALAEETGDPLGRAPGEALDEDRYPAKMLKRIAEDPQQKRKWRAQYQQTPTSDTGDIFAKDWWLYYDPEQLERMGLKAQRIYVDPAFGGNARNDETAAVVMGTLGGKFYVMDVFHERVPYHEWKKRLGHFYAKWHVPLVIEQHGWSSILTNALRSPTPGEDGDLAFPVIPYSLPGGNKSKSERATAIKTATAECVTDMVEGGMVFFPRGASWLDYTLDQLTAFPSGEHDDIVDALVMGLTHMGVEHSEAINHFYFQSAPVVYR